MSDRDDEARERDIEGPPWQGYLIYVFFFGGLLTAFILRRPGGITPLWPTGLLIAAAGVSLWVWPREFVAVQNQWRSGWQRMSPGNGFGIAVVLGFALIAFGAAMVYRSFRP